jgi:hypothetical protein
MITVHVNKSGFLSAFGHNHEIQTPLQSGEVKESDPASVEWLLALVVRKGVFRSSRK